MYYFIKLVISIGEWRVSIKVWEECGLITNSNRRAWIKRSYLDQKREVFLTFGINYKGWIINKRFFKRVYNKVWDRYEKFGFIVSDNGITYREWAPNA